MGQATLGRSKGAALLCTYFLCVAGYPPIAHYFW